MNIPIIRLLTPVTVIMSLEWEHKKLFCPCYRFEQTNILFKYYIWYSRSIHLFQTRLNMMNIWQCTVYAVLHTASCANFNTIWISKYSGRLPLKICDFVNIAFPNIESVVSLHMIHTQQTQNIFITFIQRRPNVFDVGPTLYKCYKNVCVCWVVFTSANRDDLPTLINQKVAV